MADKTLEHAKQLIARPSVTPRDEGCQALMISRLEPLGFKVERLRFGDVDNFWAIRGTGKPILAFAGHTDVVPTGPREAWTSDPFQPEVRDGHLYGRGAADMKASLAAFITSIEDFVAAHPDHRGAIALLITSDEEGPSVDGTVKVVEWLNARGIKMDYCVIGEPSCVHKFGDTLKHGRRGSLGGKLRVLGKQGHVAYPHLSLNPVHAAAPALAELVAAEWDQGNADFPKTSFQISNVHSGTGAENVIPGTMDVWFNFRHSTAVTDNDLKQRVEGVLTRHGVKYELNWATSGKPFLTTGKKLIETVQASAKAELGITPEPSTSGGTSDGRFIAPTGTEVVELGPRNATIHQVNECVAVEDLDKLRRVYLGIMSRILL
jgi:succinyl-diaminopimelate desuccinylase